MSKQNEPEETLERNKAIDNLIENITGLIDTYVAVAKLEVQNGLAYSITYLILISVFVFFSFFVLFFFSLGIAIIISSVSGISFLGYLVVASIYLALLLAIFAQRKNIKAQIDMAIADRTKND